MAVSIRVAGPDDAPLFERAHPDVFDAPPDPDLTARFLAALGIPESFGAPFVALVVVMATIAGLVGLIALAAGVALSHNTFDAALYLGVCDKIVPGLVIGALSFGHLPVAFVPAGPMVSGLSNKEKARVREDYAAGRVGRDELLAAESAAYHAPGTCTFYGTANSNQMLMEFMGLQLPGGSFVNPGTPLREKLTDEAVRRVLQNTSLGDNYIPVGEIIDEILRAVRQKGINRVVVTACSPRTHEALFQDLVRRARLNPYLFEFG